MGLFSFLDRLTSGVFSYGSVNIDTERKIRTEWEKIDSLVKNGSPSQLRQALISADKSLDTALRDIVSGESMGERLKNAKTRFDSFTYKKVWEAHKIRNNLVHETGYEPPYYVLKEAISDLRDSLYRLGLKV